MKRVLKDEFEFSHKTLLIRTGTIGVARNEDSWCLLEGCWMERETGLEMWIKEERFEFCFCVFGCVCHENGMNDETHEICNETRTMMVERLWREDGINLLMGKIDLFEDIRETFDGFELLFEPLC